MRKSRSTAFRICVTYRGPDDFWPSYRRSKSADGGKSESVPEIMRCQKKSHGHNFQNWASLSNQRGTNPLGPTLIRWGGSILKIVAVTFFCYGSSLLLKKMKFESTSGAHNSELNHLHPHMSYIFGKPWACSSTWCNPGWVLLFEKIE